MKLTRFTKTIVPLLLAVIAFTGCRKTPVNVTNIPGQNMKNLVGDVHGTTPITENDPSLTKDGIRLPGIDTTEGIAAVDPSTVEGYNADSKIFQAFTVHFDFDSTVVKSSEEHKVSAVAEHMKSMGTAKLRIEGNCDERGTEEYNRSLGERRASALRENLAVLGVDPQRILTRSYGEDKPVETGHNEAAYAKNRRGDFILLTPPQISSVPRSTTVPTSTGSL
jgi:peptidoglycan-associated lipoprotein